jgi:hypothetical protein
MAFVVPSTPVDTATEMSTGAAGDTYGAGLACTDSVLVVGAPSNDTGGTNWGVAYVYEKVLGVWTLVATFGPVDHTGATTACYYGCACACAASADVFAVGALFDNEVDGAVYVYRRTVGSWALEAKLVRPATSNGTRFGRSLAVSPDGNSVIVGCPGGTTGESVGGSAWLFTRTLGVWGAGSLIQRNDAASGDAFGFSVAASDDMATVIVSAPLDDDTSTDSGSIYVFEGSPATGYAQAHKLVSSAPLQNDRLGIMLAIKGDVIAAASHLGTTTAASGGVNIFRKSGASWSHVGSFTANAIYNTLNLGAMVANNTNPITNFYAGQHALIMPDSNTVVVPSPLDTSYNGSGYGSVWTFRADPTWETGAVASVLWPSGILSANTPRWGASVAINSTEAFVSRPLRTATDTTLGSVYRITPSPFVAAPTADTTPPTFAGITGATALAGVVTLTWDAATDAVTATDAIQYEVHVSTTPGDTWTTRAVVSAADVLPVGWGAMPPPIPCSFDLEYLAVDETYYFRVRARDAAGNVDANVAETSVYVADPTPVIPDAVPPTITVVSPTSPVIGRYEPFVLDVTDNASLRHTELRVRQGAIVETIYNGVSFVGLYTASTCVPILGDYRFTVTRTGGWVANPVFTIDAIDTSGNKYP